MEYSLSLFSIFFRLVSFKIPRHHPPLSINYLSSRSGTLNFRRGAFPASLSKFLLFPLSGLFFSTGEKDVQLFQTFFDPGAASKLNIRPVHIPGTSNRFPWKEISYVSSCSPFIVLLLLLPLPLCSLSMAPRVLVNSIKYPGYFPLSCL